MMRILVCGADGFIGAAIVRRLTGAGHRVVRGVRRPSHPDDLAIDYCRDLRPELWLPRLAGIDAVVNAVGILVEAPGKSFAAIHAHGPCALFAACQAAGVRRVVQISALGAEFGDTGYFRSKRAADRFLQESSLAWQIVRPALVYGENGASARLFRVLASLPVVGLPGDGGQRVQPIHIDDVVEAVALLLQPDAVPGQCLDLVGPEPLAYRDMLRRYRAAMGFPPAWQIPVPAPVIGMVAWLGEYWPGAVLTRDTWAMLRAGNTGDPRAASAMLGRPLRPVADFIPAEVAAARRQDALAVWRAPVLRWVLALVWLVSGLVSAFAFPRAASLALLAEVGLSGEPAVFALYGAAALDVALGIATLSIPGRRLWWGQLALVAGYSAIVAMALPEFLLHPFAPVFKNLPILAALVLLLAEEMNP